MLAMEYLQDGGFKVDTARTATEAMNKLALVPGGVDAVILDIGLPDRSGDKLAREIRALHSSLPLIIATGRGATEMREIFKGEQNLAFVEKPYNAVDLLKALRSLGIHPSASASV